MFKAFILVIVFATCWLAIGCDRASEVAAPTTAPAASAAPAVVSTPQVQPSIEQFNAYARRTLLPRWQAAAQRSDAESNRETAEGGLIANFSTTASLIETDLKKTDSLVSPIVAVAIVRERTTFNTGAVVKEFTITFRPAASAWKPIKVEQRTVSGGPEGQQVQQVALEWLADRF